MTFQVLLAHIHPHLCNLCHFNIDNIMFEKLLNGHDEEHLDRFIFEQLQKNKTISQKIVQEQLASTFYVSLNIFTIFGSGLKSKNM